MVNRCMRTIFKMVLLLFAINTINTGATESEDPDFASAFFDIKTDEPGTPPAEPAILSVSEGKCLFFDGVNDVVNAGDINAFDGTQFLTVEVWVRIDTFNAWRTFFCKFKDLGNRIQFQQYSEPGKIAVVVNNGANVKKEGNQGYFFTPNPEVTIGDWFHLAMVFDGTLPERDRLKLYINGMVRLLQRDTIGNGDVPTHMPITDAPLLLGAEKENGAYGYKGMMDEIRIWSTARSAEQIRNNMDRQLAGSETDLQLYYPVDRQIKTKLMDRTPYKHNAAFFSFDKNSTLVSRQVSVPTITASALTVVEQKPDAVDVKWTRGSGSANVVFASASNSSGMPVPESGITYVANPELGKGTQIGHSDWYCVYNGYDAKVSLTGLSPSSKYLLAVVDYNGAPGKEQYRADSTSAMIMVATAVPIAAVAPVIAEVTAAPVKAEVVVAPVKAETAVTPVNPVKEQQIVFELVKAITVGKSPLVLNVTSNSQLPITFTINDTSIAKISNDTLYTLKSGVLSITAKQTGNEYWNPAADVTRVIKIKSSAASKSTSKFNYRSFVKKRWPYFAAGGAGVILGIIIGIVVSGDDGESNSTSLTNDHPPNDPK